MLTMGAFLAEEANRTLRYKRAWCTLGIEKVSLYEYRE
jgi:hypothetical protein